ncbi:MAG: hypothetical protein RLZZ316_1490 [Bacteroidota bacterium]|jgi:outer membrane receptor protein involved in Fe transport
MNASTLRKAYRLFLCIIFFLSAAFNAFAQTSTVSGKVTDAKGVPVAGATVTVKGTTHSVVSGDDGQFRIENVAATGTLIITSVGYGQQTVRYNSNSSVAVVMAQISKTEEEVVVTGVFDKRKALSSSIAITTISTTQLDRIVPNSAVDLLKNVPGVYVNSSLGEIRNTVYSRGVTTGNNDGRWGYDYVSIQEDGLPVLNVPFGNFSPDMFLRTDAGLSKVEAVRGGSASITGANAPGGIFNYISKNGGEKFEGEVRTRFGLEGNGKNLYYRGDINFGGALNKNLTYNIGGFYRKSEGPQYPGYASNFGGQVKGNLLFKYKTGSLKLLLKLLDDHNLTAEGIPTLGYTDMKPANGFTNTSSVLPPPINVTSKLLDRGNLTYNPSNLWHSKDKSVGLNWEQNLGNNGWKFSNNMRYSSKGNEAFTPLSVVTPIAMDHIVTYFIIGALHPPTQIIPGIYNIRQGGKTIMTVQSFSGFDYHVTSNTAPGSDLSPNSLFFTPLIYQNYKVNEYLDQFTFSKRAKNMTFNFGGFFGSSVLDGIQGSQGVSLTTIQNHPQVVDITVTDYTGKTYQVTNPQGVVNVGADQGYVVFDTKQTQKALFFAHTWEMSKKLTLDWGLRYENVKIKGKNNIRALAPLGPGGADGNPLTLYDNFEAVLGQALYYNQSLSYLSFSGALNYKVSDNASIYARYSNGKKAPGLQIYLDVSTKFGEANLKPETQVIQQFELGFKSKTEKSTTSITPFISSLAHIPNNVTFTDAGGALYNPPAFYNNISTYGIEFEGMYAFSKKFDVRAAVTLQDSKAKKYKSWIHLPTGSANSPDSVVDNSGNKTANMPGLMFNVTPELSLGKFYAGLTWSYMGARQANFANAFKLPGFSQFNLAMTYDISAKFKLSANINNLTNNYGVLGWVGPGTFPDNLNLEGLTKQAIAANPNAFHQTIAIPARAYFLTATYKF